MNASVITISDLQRMKGLLSMQALAAAAGIKPNTLSAKVVRGTELTVTESMAITNALASVGLNFTRRAS